MRSFFILVNGKVKGPFPQDKVVEAIKSGRISAEAELRDAETDEIVLPSDLLNPDIGRASSAPNGIALGTESGVVEASPKRVIDYGRLQSVSTPSASSTRSASQKEAGFWTKRRGSGYITTGAVIGLFVLYHFLVVAPLQRRVDALVKWADQPFLIQR